VEKSKLNLRIPSSFDVIDLMSFTTHFNPDLSKKSESGFAFKRVIDPSPTYNLEKWSTDFTNNTFEKQTTKQGST
jgi:hypothetical protein